MKSSRAGIDTATAEPMVWRAPPRSRHTPARRAVGAGRRPGAPQAGARFIAGLLLMGGLVGGALGVEGMIQASRARSRVVSMQAELASLQQRVAADEQGAATERGQVGRVVGRATGAERSVSRSLARINWSLQSVPSEGQLSRLRAQLGADAACLGALQSEIAGLGISWKIDPAHPSADYFKLITSAPAPASCASG